MPAFIMPARIAATPPTEAITEYVGSGPFQFIKEEFQPGVKAVYRRFDGYKPREATASGMAGGKAVNVDRVEWVTMPDNQTAISALMAGEIDLIETVKLDLQPILQADPAIKTETRDELGFQALLRMNFKHPPFDNVEVRRATLAALGQQELMDAIIGNPDYYRLCGAIFGCKPPLGSETGSGSQKAGGGRRRT
jgi:peptide/nickel transport system substrate-binding protein